MKLQIKQQLFKLEETMQRHHLWQATPPAESAFQSQQPFALDCMTAAEWLQWIFIPRMHALIDANAPLPSQIAITPYLEEAMKEEAYLAALLTPMGKIEQLLQGKSC